MSSIARPIINIETHESIPPFLKHPNRNTRANTKSTSQGKIYRPSFHNWLNGFFYPFPAIQPATPQSPPNTNNTYIYSIGGFLSNKDIDIPTTTRKKKHSTGIRMLLLISGYFFCTLLFRKNAISGVKRTKTAAMLPHGSGSPKYTNKAIEASSSRIAVLYNLSMGHLFRLWLYHNQIEARR